MPSEAFEKMLALFPGGLAVPGDSVATVRAKFGPVHGHPPGDDVVVTEDHVGGVRGVWVAPKEGAVPARTLVMFHGGAFVSCRADEYTFYAAWMVREVGCRAFIVDYPLAPEQLFPAPVEAGVAAFRGLIAEGLDPAHSAFVGDSCGGGIAIASLLALRDGGGPLPACAVSLCGWLDLEASGDSATNPIGNDPFMDPQWLRERGRDYVGADGDPRDPLASPIHADLAGLRPLLLQTGQFDRCRDAAVRLAARAGRAGVFATLEVWPEMIHGFQGLYGTCPEPVWALRHVRDFVQRHTRG
jgi:acetyl esterase/lipase